MEIPGIVKERKSLKTIHDVFQHTFSGSGSKEDPYTSVDGEQSYIGIFAVVESVLQQRPVIIEVSGIRIKVEKKTFTYISGESTRINHTTKDVIEGLLSPTNYYLDLVTELSQQRNG